MMAARAGCARVSQSALPGPTSSIHNSSRAHSEGAPRAAVGAATIWQA